MGLYDRAKQFIGKRYNNLKTYTKNALTSTITLYNEHQTELPPAVHNFLNKYGDDTMTDMNVYRSPVNENIDKLINTLSAGNWQKSKMKLGYDNFFHLFLVFKINDLPMMYEKNQSINFITYIPDLSDFEHMPVVLPNIIRLKDFVNASRKQMGKNYLTYDPFTNNCQSFILGSLLGNGLLTEPLKQFIYQDISQLIKEQPSYLNPVVKAFTDIGGLADRFLQKTIIPLDERREGKEAETTQDTPNTIG